MEGVKVAQRLIRWQVAAGTANNKQWRLLFGDSAMRTQGFLPL